MAINTLPFWRCHIEYDGFVIAMTGSDDSRMDVIMLHKHGNGGAHYMTVHMRLSKVCYIFYEQTWIERW